MKNNETLFKTTYTNKGQKLEQNWMVTLETSYIEMNDIYRRNMDLHPLREILKDIDKATRQKVFFIPVVENPKDGTLMFRGEAYDPNPFIIRGKKVAPIKIQMGWKEGIWVLPLRRKKELTPGQVSTLKMWFGGQFEELVNSPEFLPNLKNKTKIDNLQYLTVKIGEIETSIEFIRNFIKEESKKITLD